MREWDNLGLTPQNYIQHEAILRWTWISLAWGGVGRDEVQQVQAWKAESEAAQKAGDIRPDINPEFLWLVLEKLAELVKDGTWQSVFTKFSRYQKQLRTLLFYGLLARREEKK